MTTNTDFFTHSIGNKPHIIMGTATKVVDNVPACSLVSSSDVEHLLVETIVNHKRVIIELADSEGGDRQECVGIRGLVVASYINTDKESYRLVVDKLQVRTQPNGRKNYNPIATTSISLGGKGFSHPRKQLVDSVMEELSLLQDQ